MTEVREGQEQIQESPESKEGDQPREGQSQIQAKAEEPNLEELKLSHKYWKSLEDLCQRFPDAGKEINQVVSDYLSGKRTKTEVKAEIQKTVEAVEKKEEKTEKKEEPSFSQYENRIRELEKEVMNTKIDNAVKKLSANEKYGTKVVERQKELEEAVFKAGLIPAINAGTLSLERAFEMVWKDIDYDNQLTRGKNEVISEIEQKREAQGPQLQKSNVVQMAPVRAKTFREALLQAEKELGVTIDEVKESLYRK